MDISKNKSSPASGLNGILINMGESLNGLLDNGVNGTGVFCEGASSGRCPVGEQCGPGRHPATARMWQEIGLFESTQQRICDQARAIRKNGWLSELEIEVIKRKIKKRVIQISRV